MAWIDAILESDRSVHEKQRHTAHRIFERLRDEQGFHGGYTIVREYVLSNFQLTLDILVTKNSNTQRAIVDAEAALAAAVKSVIAEEVSPLLCRMQDCENAAATLRSELRALQNSGRWGLCPESLSARLAREPSGSARDIGMASSITPKANISSA
jgi:hypothetical protein